MVLFEMDDNGSMKEEAMMMEGYSNNNSNNNYTNNNTNNNTNSNKIQKMFRSPKSKSKSKTDVQQEHHNHNHIHIVYLPILIIPGIASSGLLCRRIKFR